MNCPNDDEDDDDEEEEEVIVYANFEEGTVDPEIFKQPNLKLKIIGLESDNPVVQLGDTIFKGAWNDTIGTKLIFDEDSMPEQADPVFTVLPPKMFKFNCMSTKSLDLSKILLKVKKEGNTDGTTETLINDKECLKSLVSEGEQGILELAQCTIKPELDTDEIMEGIVKESSMDLDEDELQENP